MIQLSNQGHNMGTVGRTGDTRELKILEVLQTEPEIRQVDLATRLGVAVGTVNWLLKRLTVKGYVKVKRIGQWHWRYLLTPRGVAEKARLTQHYLRDSLELYQQTRQMAQRLLQDVLHRGYEQVLLDGKREDPIVDICRLTCLEQGVKVVSSAGSALSSTHYSPLTTNSINPTNPRPVESHSYGATNSTNSTNQNDVPVLRVVGREIILEWPKEMAHD